MKRRGAQARRAASADGSASADGGVSAPAVRGFVVSKQMRQAGKISRCDQQVHVAQIRAGGEE